MDTVRISGGWQSTIWLSATERAPASLASPAMRYFRHFWLPHVRRPRPDLPDMRYDLDAAASLAMSEDHDLQHGRSGAAPAPQDVYALTSQVATSVLCGIGIRGQLLVLSRSAWVIWGTLSFNPEACSPLAVAYCRSQPHCL